MSQFNNSTPIQYGENGITEYSWSNNLREKIIQLNFQLTRVKSKPVIDNLALQTKTILKTLKNDYNNKLINKQDFMLYLSVMYKMIGFTRDIISGKGEYNLSYMLLDVWHMYYPDLAKYAFKLFVLTPNQEDCPNNNQYSIHHPYGSWKDIKYSFSNNLDHPLKQYGMELLIDQIREDEKSTCPSLAAKWVPREKSKFSNLFERLALIYFNNYISTAIQEETRVKAIKKAKTDFRKLISSLNKKLDTVQIKQCNNDWSNICPNNQTSITLNKQMNAFLNINKDGSQRSTKIDRINCANNFKDFIEQINVGERTIKGKRICLTNFTKKALFLINNNQINSDCASLLNAQWINNSTQTKTLGKIIPMIDVSGSMQGESLHAAIALGIRVAEKSIIGKRIMTFSAVPNWINLSDANNFVEMVEKVSKSDWGMNADFSLALDRILEAIISEKLTPEDVEDMVLAIFSDMQIDTANINIQQGSLMKIIEDKYAETGRKLWGRPFKPPHILFWNLRSTSGFPNLSIQKNTSMMSGFNPSALNLFSDHGINGLDSYNPWSQLTQSLNNERYKPLDDYIKMYFHTDSNM